MKKSILIVLFVLTLFVAGGLVAKAESSFCDKNPSDAKCSNNGEGWQ